MDAQLGPGFPFDTYDLPTGTFLSASEAWRQVRQGAADPDLFGVYPTAPIKGDWFVRNYVVQELAHLNKYELLLWDEWGAMSGKLTGDLDLIDQAAELMLQGDAVWERIIELYKNPVLNVPSQVHCYSPTGLESTVSVA